VKNSVIKIELFGDKKLIAKFKRLKLSVKAGIKDAVNDSALNIMTDAKKRLRDWPAIDTGRLRSSIRPEFFNMGMAAEIGTNVAYAAFVEFGTGRKGSSTLPGNIPLPQGYKHGGISGMRARPYLFPAYFAEEKDFQKAISKLVQRESRKAKSR